MSGPGGPDGPEAWLGYFGYGSNMDRGTFLGRRGMRPRAACAAQLRGFSLCFDLPVGPGERGVANLRPDPEGLVWGVLWQISIADSERLDRTEGVHRGYYRRVAVEVETAEGSRHVAFTYGSAHGRPGRKPSARYLGLLLAGARDHRLPEPYVASLRALPLAVDERAAAQGELFPRAPRGPRRARRGPRRPRDGDPTRGR